MIKAVLFDYGGVLSPGGKNFRGSLAAMLGVDQDALNIDDLRNQLWNGQISTESFFAKLSERQGRPVLVEDFLVASQIMEKYDLVYNLAQDIRQAGLKTAILSNMYKTSAVALRASGNYDNFDPVILSFQEGMAKPDLAIYHLACQKLGCQPQEILFIDDQERFLLPAQQLGFHVIQAKQEEQIVADTKALLLKENSLKL